MGLKLKNDAVSRLASNISSSDTSILLTPGSGVLFPILSSGDYFPATLIKVDGSHEIVKVTARSTDTLTVVRSQEGTAAQAFNANDKIELRLTAGTLTDPSGPTSASILAATTKTTPIDSDAFGFIDSEDAYKLKKFTLANLKTVIKSTVLGYVYPVGSIYINASSITNPAELLGIGTWEEIGAGRVLVGQNTSDTLFDALGETGGSKDAIVVSHDHDATISATIGAAGAHNHTVADPGHFHNTFGNRGGGGAFGFNCSSVARSDGTNTDGPSTTATTGISINGVGDHTHSISATGTISTEGSSGANANLQPYLVVKMWKRTA